MITDKIGTVLDSLNAYNARDLEMFMSYYDDSCKFLNAANIDLVHTKEDMDKFYTTSFRSSPSAQCEVLGILHLGDFVAVQERLSGIVSQTNEEITLETIAMYKVQQGKIVELRHHFA